MYIYPNFQNMRNMLCGNMQVINMHVLCTFFCKNMQCLYAIYAEMPKYAIHMQYICKYIYLCNNVIF